MASASSQEAGAAFTFAGLLAIAAALIGSFGYVWALTNGTFSVPTYEWAYVAGWAIPLALVALLHIARAIPSLLGAGVFLGLRLGVVAGYFPWYNLLGQEGTTTGIPSCLWFAVAAGAVAIVAGLIAATARRTTVA